MKINLATIFIFASLFVANIQAQTWGEVGTKWVYARTAVQGPSRHYFAMKIEKDTLIHNLPCKKIATENHSYWYGDSWNYGGASPDAPIYMRASNDSIFLYNASDSTFEFLYSFAPNVGDTWLIQNTEVYNECQNTLPPQDTLVVEAIKADSFGNRAVEIITVSEGKEWNLGSKIIKNIGPVSAYQPRPGDNCEGVDIGWEWSLELTCFFHPDWGTIGEGDICSRVTAISDVLEKKLPLYISPNPTVDEVNLLGNITDISTIIIYDVMGRVVKQIHNFSDSKHRAINISDLEKGVYLFYIQLGGNNGNTSVHRIIKN